MPGSRLEPLSPSPARLLAPGVALSAAAMCFAAGLGVAAALIGGRAPAPAADPCALPAGIDLAALPDRDRSLALRHALACADLEHGRISGEDFRDRVFAAPPPPAPALAPVVQWASTVIAKSSEYGAGDWSAARVLGPPDVWPASGDQGNAWASRGADDAVEYLHVGFDQPRRLSGLEIFETFNPGAITKVELITADGGLWTVYNTEAAAQGTPTHYRKLTFACTDLPVTSVKLTLDSPAVPGWNEIDAIGAVPCVVPSPTGG